MTKLQPWVKEIIKEEDAAGERKKREAIKARILKGAAEFDKQNRKKALEAENDKLAAELGELVNNSMRESNAVRRGELNQQMKDNDAEIREIDGLPDPPDAF